MFLSQNPQFHSVSLSLHSSHTLTVDFPSVVWRCWDIRIACASELQIVAVWTEQTGTAFLKVLDPGIFGNRRQGGWAWSVGPSTQSRLTGRCRGSLYDCSVKNSRHSLVLVPVLLPAGLGPYVQDKAVLFQAGVCGFSCSVAGTRGWDLPPFPLLCSLSLSTFPTLFCTLSWALSHEYHSHGCCSLSTSVPQ
jgi:hypothetical protein